MACSAVASRQYHDAAVWFHEKHTLLVLAGIKTGLEQVGDR